MQGLAQRVTAVRPDLVNSDATFGELAWIWGKGHASDGGTWPRRLWFSGGELVAWGWAYLPHEVRRSDGSVRQVTGAYLALLAGKHGGSLATMDQALAAIQAGKFAPRAGFHCTWCGYRELCPVQEEPLYTIAEAMPAKATS